MVAQQITVRCRLCGRDNRVTVIALNAETAKCRCGYRLRWEGAREDTPRTPVPAADPLEGA